MPDPVAVTLDPSTTAFLALDFTASTCSLPNRPACAATLPAVNNGIAAARAANVPVIFTDFATSAVVPDIEVRPGDPVLVSRGADKFLLSDLGPTLEQIKPTTVVIAGTFTNGAVLFTAFEAAARGYTVVVAQDGVSDPTDFSTAATLWQLMTGPGTSNPQNNPLMPKVVTLSRTDLITYK